MSPVKAPGSGSPKITCRELGPELWPALEKLFSPNGACGGCWCMWWRIERGGRMWEEIRGAPAQKRLKKLVQGGEAKGILAFEGEKPVGWCSFGPRAGFPRLETVKAFRRDDTAHVWCVNCFFIAKGCRGQGVARRLLEAALGAMRRRGVETVEAYPVTTTEDGRLVSSSMAFTGPIGLFEEQGFREVQRLSPTRPLVRLKLAKRKGR